MNKTLLSSILSSLIPHGEGIRSSSIESISLQYTVVSDLFSRCRFPKLWHLHLYNGIETSSWEYLSLHTTALTTLHLAVEAFSHSPTTHQLLSILASNPCLQDLTLSGCEVPRDNGNGSTLHVQLRHLKRLSLVGHFHPVFQLLHRLAHPDKVDIALFVSRCTVGDTLGTLGPYLQDYLQRNGRFRDGLGIFVYSRGRCVSIQASIPSDARSPTEKAKFATFTTVFEENLSSPTIDKLCAGLVAYTPREQVNIPWRGPEHGRCEGDSTCDAENPRPPPHWYIFVRRVPAARSRWLACRHETSPITATPTSARYHAQRT